MSYVCREGGLRIALAIGLFCTGVIGANAAPTNGETAVTIPGHVLPALTHATKASSGGKARITSAELAPVTLTVVLRRTDPVGFATYLQDVYDPQSQNFHHFLSPTQITDRFGPTEQDYQAVSAYFTQQGFTLGEGSANRMTLTLNGTRALASSALAVNIEDYRIADKDFFANDADPSLPAAIAARVEAVIGLSNLATPTAKPQPMLNNLPANDAGLAVWEGFCLEFAYEGGTVSPSGKFDLSLLSQIQDVFQIIIVQLNFLNVIQSPSIAKNYIKCVNTFTTAKAYGGKVDGGDPPPPAWQHADGTGQTVGLLEFDTFQLSDVSDFINLMGPSLAGPLGNVSQVHVNGGATAGANQSEVLLDIDVVLGAAPGAKIVVFDGPFTGPGTSFQSMFNAMINGGVTIISNSWSYCEDQTTLADVQSIDTILQSAAASGISVFTGAGDHGSTCLDGSANTAGVPATSPHITAVGGTSLQKYPGFTYGPETWWDASNSSPPGGQGGFGVSRFFNRPAYQDAVSGAAMRSIPDVSASADPATGVIICQASAGGCPTGSFYGGTSASAPLWAAFGALLNQTQGANLGFFNPLLYPLADTSAFHSAASMGSDFAHVGLGSPNLARLHQRLTGQSVGPASPTLSNVQAYAQTTATVSPGGPTPLPALADGNNQTFVVVTLVDPNGIPIGGKNIALAGNAGNHALIEPSNVDTGLDSGVAMFKITNTSVETVTLTATDTSDGMVLNDQPQIAFQAPPAAGASIGAAPTTVLNDGIATATITITLRDASNNPSPGKLVSVAQGGGHSIITGPSPSVTDPNGAIQFTVTDLTPETVTYTAIDVTDANLSVPGSAVVTFSGQANASCVPPPPTAAAGFTLTPFSTGYLARNFTYSGINFGGCPGGSSPTFDTAGNVYVSDSPSGNLYKLGAGGGAASNGSILASIGLTLGQPVFGKDGSLYVARAASGSGSTSGNITRIDPATGAAIQTVASGLTCPGPLAIDPLSGDLFFADICSGGGLDNPSLFRISNPNTATPGLSVYATLPGTPNGAVAIAPNGTMYAAVSYTSADLLAQVSGTNTSQPATVTTLAGINSIFWVTLGQVQANGAAKSLIVLAPSGLNLVDITTIPFAVTPLTNGQIGSGTIGPDGCLYTGGNDTIYRLAPNAGGCGFTATNPSPALTLAPTTVSPNPAQGTTQTFTATFANVSVPAGTPVTFTVTGANSRVMLATTGSSGSATISYVGAFSGTDTVIASGLAGVSTLTSTPAQVTWVAGKHVTFLDLSTSPSGGIVGVPVTLRASLSDATQTPPAAILGAPILFTVGALSCNGVTNAAGVATCNVTPSTSGQFLSSTTYAGSALYTPATGSQRFNVVVPVVSGPTTTFTSSSATGTGNITAAFNINGACTFNAAQYIPLTGNVASPPLGSAPAGVTFPQGLFDFTASNCTPGSTLNFTVTYPQPLPPGTQYWKYGPTSDNAAAHWYTLSTAVINGNTVTFSITDGGLGDDDLAANGNIVDPGGPGVPGTSGGGSAIEPIPTLSDAGTLLLLALLALLGTARLSSYSGHKRR
jgi:Pro-kumamolisin, activation domain/Bacterial Ig-like domain (group 1)